MKKCPFCAEDIQAQAIKCRYCGEFLDGFNPSAKSSDLKWYYNTSIIIVAMLCVGPLALPLVWMHPKYKIITKIWVTVLVIAGTALLMHLTAMAYKNFMEMFDALK